MASQAPPAPRWEKAFGVASLLAALAQGVVLGTLTAHLTVVDGAFSGSPFGAIGWFSVLSAVTVAAATSRSATPTPSGRRPGTCGRGGTPRPVSAGWRRCWSWRASRRQPHGRTAEPARPGARHRVRRPVAVRRGRRGDGSGDAAAGVSRTTPAAGRAGDHHRVGGHRPGGGPLPGAGAAGTHGRQQRRHRTPRWCSSPSASASTCR